MGGVDDIAVGGGKGVLPSEGDLNSRTLRY